MLYGTFITRYLNHTQVIGIGMVIWYRAIHILCMWIDEEKRNMVIWYRYGCTPLKRSTILFEKQNYLVQVWLFGIGLVIWYTYGYLVYVWLLYIDSYTPIQVIYIAILLYKLRMLQLSLFSIHHIQHKHNIILFFIHILFIWQRAIHILCMWIDERSEYGYLVQVWLFGIGLVIWYRFGYLVYLCCLYLTYILLIDTFIINMSAYTIIQLYSTC